MEASPSERPTIVVVGVGVVCVAAVLFLAQAWDSLASIGSAATQDSFRRAVEGHQMSVEELTGIVRAGRIVAAAAAAVCAVFALSALGGRRDSRIALTIGAAVVAFGGLLINPLLDVTLVFGAFLVVGSAPARAWYAGRPLPKPQERSQAASVRPAEPMPSFPVPAPVVVQTPVVREKPTGPRPTALLTALACLWGGIGLALLVIAGALLALLDDRAGLVAWTRARLGLDPLSVSALQAAAIVTVGLVLVGFSLLLLAILGLAVFRGGSTARFLLLLATVGGAGLGFGAVAGAHLSGPALAGVLLASIAGVVSLVLLMTPSVSEYFGDRPAAEVVPPISPPPTDEHRFPPSW